MRLRHPVPVPLLALSILSNQLSVEAQVKFAGANEVKMYRTTKAEDVLKRRGILTVQANEVEWEMASLDRQLERKEITKEECLGAKRRLMDRLQFLRSYSKLLDKYEESSPLKGGLSQADEEFEREVQLLGGAGRLDLGTFAIRQGANVPGAHPDHGGDGAPPLEPPKPTKLIEEGMPTERRAPKALFPPKPSVKPAVKAPMLEPPKPTKLIDEVRPTKWRVPKALFPPKPLVKLPVEEAEGRSRSRTRDSSSHRRHGEESGRRPHGEERHKPAGSRAAGHPHKEAEGRSRSRTRDSSSHRRHGEEHTHRSRSKSRGRWV